MNPTELARQFLADLMRLPLLVWLIVLVGVVEALRKWWVARQKSELLAESANWPVYKARVVWAQVSDRKYEGEDGPSYIEGVLTYSYTVPGHDLEIGEFYKRFDEEEEANDWARALRDTFVDIRVDPADVTRSVWQETPILTSPAPLAPRLESSILRESDSRDIRNILATAVFYAAAVGAFLAVWIQLSCLRGKPLISAESNEPAFLGMHLGAIACGLTAALVAKRGKWSRSTWRNTFQAGTTGIAMKILGFYTTVVFFYGWVRMSARDGDPRYFGILMFSAIWLVFYVTAATVALQAMEHRESNPN